LLDGIEPEVVVGVELEDEVGAITMGNGISIVGPSTVVITYMRIKIMELPRLS